MGGNVSVISSYVSGTVSTASTDVFLKFGGYLFDSTGSNSTEIITRTAGTLSKYLVRITANSLSTSTDLQLRINGANGNLVIAVGTGTTGNIEDTTHTDTLAAGDQPVHRFSQGQSGATGTVTMTIISLIFAATTDTVQFAILSGSATGLSSASTNYYQPPFGRLGTNTTESLTKWRIRKSFTAAKLQVTLSSNSRTTNTVFSSRKNGAAGSQTVTFGSGETGEKEDTTHSDTLAAGDDYNYNILTSTGTQTFGFQMMKTELLSTGGDSCVLAADAVPITQAEPITTNYPLAGRLIANSTESNCQMKTRFDYTANNLVVFVSANTVNSSTTCFLRKGAANVNNTVTIGSSATGLFNDSSHTDSIVSTDLCDYQVITPAVSGSQTITISQIGIYMNVTTTTPVNQTYTHKYKITGRATTTKTHKYKIVGRANRTFTQKYKIRALVNSTKTHKYKIIGRANRTFTQKYKIIGRATRTFIQKYKIVGRVTKTFTHKYKIKLLVTKTYIHLYKIIGRANRTFTQKYKIIGRATRIFTQKYKIVGRATQTFTHKYRILILATRTFTQKYKIVGRATKTFTHIYKIKVLVNKTFTHKYKIKLLVNQTFVHKYKITGRATHTFTHIYKIIGLATKTFTHKYKIFSLVAKTFTHKYKLIGRATRTFTHLYKILNSSFVSRTYTHIYKIIQHVNQTFTHKYKIRQLVTKVFTQKYKIIGRATRTFTQIYKIVQHINRTYTHIYNIKVLVNVTKTHRYKIRQLVTATKTHIYKIIGRASRVFTQIYKIKTLINRTFTHSYKIHGPAVSIVFTHKYKIIGRVSRTWIHRYNIIGSTGVIDFGIQINIAKAEASGKHPRALQNENLSIDEDTRRLRKNSEKRIFTRRVSSAARSRRRIG